jgi:copper chaperone CopZ
MKPVAEIIHQTRGRTRFRVLGKRRDDQFFSDIEKKLAKLPGIESVQTNPLASSVLLMHPDSEPQDTLNRVEKLGIFDSIETDFEPKTTGLTPETFTKGFAQVEDSFSAFTEKEHTPVFFLLIGLAAIQAARGNILGPAIPLLGYALELTQNAQAKQPKTNL